MKTIASLHAFKIDAEGEACISFKIPQSNVPDIIELSLLTEQLLELTINIEGASVNDNTAGKENAQEDTQDNEQTP